MPTRPTPPRLPLPTHVRPPAANPYPRDGEIGAWAEWEARLDASAGERRMPDAVAVLLANDALFRRRRAEQEKR